MPKRPQLCLVQTMRLAVQRNRDNLKLCCGHECLNGNQQECKAQMVGRELFLMKLGVADYSVVVVGLPRISLEAKLNSH